MSVNRVSNGQDSQIKIRYFDKVIKSSSPLTNKRGWMQAVEDTCPGECKYHIKVRARVKRL